MESLVLFFCYFLFWGNPSVPKCKTNGTIIKATKDHVMSSAPFDVTIMLDFDSFPCQRDLEPLLDGFNKDADADIGVSNIFNSMEYLTDSKYFLGEHNSAVVVLNMTSIRTRLMLALYTQAFHRASEFAKLENKRMKQRDQPALMVACKLCHQSFSSQIMSNVFLKFLMSL